MHVPNCPHVVQVCRDEYCAIDETTGEQVLLSIEEKERIFLDSIQSFYYRYYTYAHIWYSRK